MATDAPAWVWNLSSIGGVAVVPLQAPYIMSKHAVLALTECLHLEVKSAGHDHHVHVQAVLPGAVVSNIFESAGGVNSGDAGAAEAQRTAMLDIKAEAMDPIAAAEVVFEQAAEGRFYLLTQPDYVGSAMAERARVLTSQEPPPVTYRTPIRPPRAELTCSPNLTRTPQTASLLSASSPRCVSGGVWPQCGPAWNRHRCPICRRWRHRRSGGFGPGGPIPLRLYRPPPNPSHPCSSTSTAAGW